MRSLDFHSSQFMQLIMWEDSDGEKFRSSDFSQLEAFAILLGGEELKKL